MPQEPATTRFSTGFPSEVLSVAELNRNVRDLLEHRFPLLWVRGEISNFVAARSGHFYFVLKDAQAQVRCAMFRNRNQLLAWQPRDGMQVEIQGLVTLYENRGEFQLIAETVRQAGRGNLFEAFLRLKDKLAKEGLFDAERKRPLPFLPRCIGIVTSNQGAALRDVLATLARRNPSISVIVFPTPVQGEGAGQKIAQAIVRAGAQPECEVIIVCRGGGSLEDLWAFNEEVVARAICACPVPVISGVGHETDFSLADFAADVRAPTPTAAAELVSPERAGLLVSVSEMLSALRRRMLRELENRSQAVDYLVKRLHSPQQRLRERKTALSQVNGRLVAVMLRRIEQANWMTNSLIHRLRARTPRISEFNARLDHLLERLHAATQSICTGNRLRLDGLISSLEHLAPQGVLERGYCLARDESGALVRDSSVLQPGSRLDLTFSKGTARTLVESATQSES